MRLIFVRKRKKLADRIREILSANGGSYAGVFDLAVECETTKASLLYQLRQMTANGRVRIHRARGGRGCKTKVMLVES